MSSILKALKKLEQETLDRQTEATTATGLNIRPERNRREEKARRTTNEITRWVWIFCLSLLFIGTGAFVIFFPHGPGTITPPPPKTAQPPKPVPVKTAAKPTPGFAVVVADLPKPYAPATHAAPSPPPAPAAHAAPPQRPGPTHPDTSPQLPGAVTPGAISAPAPKTQDNSPQLLAPEPQDTSPQPPAPEIHDAADTQIPILEDASLTINAISWSTAPEKRLAVINSTLVREGQAVGGFRLVEIQGDQVIVQRSQKKWRVMFRLR